MSSNILYYPTIEFTDETWLKSSLCVWDKIYRIVPTSYSPNDTDNVKKAIDAGVIENIVLTEKDLSDTAEEFIKFVDTVNILPSGLDGLEPSRLHLEKVDKRVLPILKDLSIGVDVEGFLNIKPEIANLYMLYLSDAVSKRRGISKLTDNGDMFSIMHYFANDGNFNEQIYNEDAEEFSSVLALTSILPKGLEETDIEKVLQFRKETSDNRKYFKESLDSLISEITAIDDKTFTLGKVNEYISNLESNNLDLMDRVKYFVDDFQFSLLSVGLPTALTTFGLLGTMKGDIYDLKNIAGSCFIGAISAIADSSKTKRKKWKSEDAFYYHQLQNVFGNKKGVEFTTPNFHRIYEEFIND